MNWRMRRKGDMNWKQAEIGQKWRVTLVRANWRVIWYLRSYLGEDMKWKLRTKDGFRVVFWSKPQDPDIDT
jgi:hypothetical protein